MIEQLNARDYRAPGRILAQDYQTMLRDDPKAFDCLIYPALPGKDEKVAVDEDVVGALDNDERKQSFGDPVLGRAMIIPEEGFGFDVLSGEVAQSFYGASAPMNVLLSMQVPEYSLVQWKEYITPEAEEPEIRTVYVLDVKAAGRVAGVGTYYVCAPLPAIGEVPGSKVEPEEPESPDAEKLDEKYSKRVNDYDHKVYDGMYSEDVGII